MKKHPQHPVSIANDIVLIPGFMCDTFLWELILPDLQELGSVHFADLNHGDSIDAMALRIISELPSSCILIGFSLGGYVARRIAVLAPEKINQLVLLNTSARATSQEEKNRNLQQIKMLKAFPYKGQTITALKRALHPDNADNTALLTKMQNMSLALGREVFIRQLSLVREDGYADFEKILCPTLVVASRQDQMRSLVESENIVSALPHPTYHVLDQCGHMSPLEKPRELAKLLHSFITIEVTCPALSQQVPLRKY
ncbi:alpha/beta fold hydrolase [Undibacterium sp. Ji67W]|uniref:alpha/beta fold hydrolase n=1 Tax=Undibacterium sp. Ji67W TaxID=3413042 RepID=UPI003BF201CC